MYSLKFYFCYKKKNVPLSYATRWSVGVIATAQSPKSDLFCALKLTENVYFLEHFVARSFVQLDQAMFCPKLSHFPIAFWTFSFQYNLYIVKYYTQVPKCTGCQHGFQTGLYVHI